MLTLLRDYPVPRVASVYFSDYEKDSTQPLNVTIANNNQGTESPQDPENNQKKYNTQKSDKCIIKTPVFPSTPVKVYHDAKKSKLDMLSDLKTKLCNMWFNKITGKVYIGSAIEGKKRLSRVFYAFGFKD